MPQLKVKYLKVYRDRHGKTRYFFRRKGCKEVSLPDIDHPDFLAQYQAALTGAPKREIGASPTPGRTITDLIILWMKSAHFQSLEGSTKAVYIRLLNRMREQQFANFAAATMQTKHARSVVEIMGDGAPTTGTRILRLLRQLMQYAIELGWRDDDPTIGIKAARAKTDGIHSWTDTEIATYENHWPSGSYQRLAIALLLYTGQRRSDVVRMGPADRVGDVIHVRQQKTGVNLVIPVHPHLMIELESWKGTTQTYLTGARGHALSVNGFYNVFKDWCREAGLAERCSPHGLRKAAARRLAEAGCTTHQIAAITGHKTLTEISRYTKAAEQRLLAKDAMQKLDKSV